MNPNRQLSEGERIREIGELLATAVIRSLRDQICIQRGSPLKVPQPPVTEVWDLVDDEVEKTILRYLAANVSAQPRQMEKTLNVSHMTLARRLVRLRDAGLLIVSGRTKGAYYALAAQGERN